MMQWQRTEIVLLSIRHLDLHDLQLLSSANNNAYHIVKDAFRIKAFWQFEIITGLQTYMDEDDRTTDKIY